VLGVCKGMFNTTNIFISFYSYLPTLPLAQACSVELWVIRNNINGRSGAGIGRGLIEILADRY
jgi:hypothetical protein